MNKKQLFLNITANILAFAVSTGINFFLTPYIINSVGIDAYGFLPLASNFTSYITVITSAFNSMSGRFITVKMHENKEEEAKQYFSTTFFVNLGLAVFSAMVFLFTVILLENFINIPSNILEDVKLLFAFTFMATVIGLITAVYGVATFCQNRLDYKSMVSIGGTVLRATILIFAFVIFKPKLFYIGLATVVITIYEGIVNYKISNKLLPQLKVDFRYFQKNLIRVLLSSGIWNSFNLLSSVLMTGLDLLITNMFIGAEEAGILGIIKVVPGLIYTIVSLMITSFAPQFVQDFAHNDMKGLVKNMDFSAKLVGFISVIPLAGFVAYGKEFYQLWVPTQNAELLVTLSVLSMISCLVSYPISAFDNTFTAANKLKWPAIAVFICGMLNVIIVFLLLKFTNLGIFAIAATSSVLIMLKDLFFKIPYVAKCVNINPIHFWKFIIRYIIAFACIIVLSFIVKAVVVINTWALLIVDATITVAFALLFNYLILLDKEEKAWVINRIRKVFNK